MSDTDPVPASTNPESSDPTSSSSIKSRTFFVFPAGGTVTEQDVKDAFSKYGVVDDIGLPYLSISS